MKLGAQWGKVDGCGLTKPKSEFTCRTIVNLAGLMYILGRAALPPPAALLKDSQ